MDRLMNTRIETDAFGDIEVGEDKYWGAQTERALKNFQISGELMPKVFIHALGLQKLAAAQVNMLFGELTPYLGTPIVQAAKEVWSGKFDDQFPLVIWQSGSATQTHMNCNEVIAGRANEILTGHRGGKSPVHPNDHVNYSQSSNDSITTAMNIATVIEIHHTLLPAIEHMKLTLLHKVEVFKDIIKVGRTHLQDATPITLGQEFSAWARQIELAEERISSVLPRLYLLAQGGTAVGTGLNSKRGFDVAFADQISTLTKFPFKPAINKFEALSTHDSLVELSGVLNTLAAGLMKIANDIRLLSSGPRCGLGEITIPANEPGSSIMPGKVNPSQVEAMTMVCAQVIGNHLAITIGGMSGSLELNVFKPVIIYNILNSIKIISDVVRSFSDNCLQGIEANQKRIKNHLDQSVMIVSVLNAILGYDQTTKIAQKAYEEKITIKQAALEHGLLSKTELESYLRPENMISPLD
ncbi:MAG: class II fumarate hydratase [Oligoflexia bacterium]|nr:class II fumarate hydratase [Oligoflexia bacterium]